MTAFRKLIFAMILVASTAHASVLSCNGALSNSSESESMRLRLQLEQIQEGMLSFSFFEPTPHDRLISVSLNEPNTFGEHGLVGRIEALRRDVSGQPEIVMSLINMQLTDDLEKTIELRIIRLSELALKTVTVMKINSAAEKATMAKAFEQAQAQKRVVSFDWVSSTIVHRRGQVVDFKKDADGKIAAIVLELQKNVNSIVSLDEIDPVTVKIVQ